MTNWLDEEQQRVWRRWLRVNRELGDALARHMQDHSSLSMSDFGVLVALTDVEEGQLRVSELADVLSWERSRVSHHLRRMEQRGLVCRNECSEDGRGSYVAITERGRTAIEEAAPAHVEEVRRLFVDALSPEELAVLGRIDDKLLAGLDG